MAKLVIYLVSISGGISGVVVLAGQALRGTRVARDSCDGLAAMCGFLDVNGTHIKIDQATSELKVHADAHRDVLLSSLGSKIDSGVKLNADEHEQTRLRITAEHDKTRLQLEQMQTLLVAAMAEQARAAAKDWSLDILAKIFPRLDAINDTVSINMDREKKLEAARVHIAELANKLTTAEREKKAYESEVHDPLSMIFVMFALGIAAFSGEEMNTRRPLQVCLIWLAYKAMCYVAWGAMLRFSWAMILVSGGMVAVWHIISPERSANTATASQVQALAPPMVLKAPDADTTAELLKAERVKAALAMKERLSKLVRNRPVERDVDDSPRRSLHDDGDTAPPSYDCDQ